MRQAAQSFAYRPLISIITPVFNPAPQVLKATIESVRAQTYDHWEFCLVDGGSDAPGVKALLDAYGSTSAASRCGSSIATRVSRATPTRRWAWPRAS